jgi:tight adherence protein C
MAQKVLTVMFAIDLYLAIWFISTPDIITSFTLIIFLAIVLYFPDRRLKSKIAEKRMRLQFSFLDYLNILILLTGTGLNVYTALEKAAAHDSCFNKEIMISITDFRSGKTFAESFEKLALRCEVFEITTFASILIQNIKKGTAEITSTLFMHNTTCRESYKAIVRKSAEELSTKLLFPTSIMFIAILIMVAFPAVVQFKI